VDGQVSCTRAIFRPRQMENNTDLQLLAQSCQTLTLSHLIWQQWLDDTNIDWSLRFKIHFSITNIYVYVFKSFYMLTIW